VVFSFCLSPQYPRRIILLFHGSNMNCSSQVPPVCWKWYRTGVANVTMLKWYTPKDNTDMHPMTTRHHKLWRPRTEISFRPCLLNALPISDSYSLLKINYNWCNDYNMLWHNLKDDLGIKYKTIKSKKKSYLRNRPWRPIGLRGVKDPTLSRQSAHS
jgi:hypothetical protein